MPGSARENDEFVKEFVQANDIRTVLDVGAGKGTYAQILSPVVNTIDAIEVWQPYIDEFDLENQYDLLWKGDAREFVKHFSDKEYDLIVFGDILEHMSKEDSLELWSQASRVAKWGLISVPIIHYPQGAEFGNPYEVHVQEHLHTEDILSDYGPFHYVREYEITGTFVKRF